MTSPVASIDVAIEKLEQDLAALKRAREVLVGASFHFTPGALVPLQVKGNGLTATVEPFPKVGRDRASVTASYAALAPYAGMLEPKACRAVKMRGAGKMPGEIATAMKLDLKQVANLLLSSRRRLEKARQSGKPTAAAAAAAEKAEDPEPVPAAPPRETSGVNELVQARLEQLRKPETKAPVFDVGKIVVVERDGLGKQLARVLEVLDNGMTRVQRVDRYNKPILRKSWVLAPGEIIREASARKTTHKNVRYEIHDLPDGAIVPDAVLPPGLRNIA